MTSVRIVLLDRATFVPEVRFHAERIPGARWREYPVTAPGDIVDHVGRDTEVVAVNKVRLTGEILAQLPGLRMVAITATGTDNVDLGHAREHGIAVANVRDYATVSVPEHVIALAFALRRRLFDYAEAARDGRWVRSPFFCVHAGTIEELSGAAFGIIGGGALGRATGALAQALGMRVLLAERRGATAIRAGRVAFDAVLAEADVLSLHLPLTPETHHLIGAGELARMKPGAILINTARGALVEPQAVIEALRSGRLGGAGIDVLDAEPPPPDHPLLTARLSNLIVTPHIAWASRQAQQKLADESIENIAAFVRGESRNRVA